MTRNERVQHQRQRVLDQLLRDANQVAYAHQLRTELAIISGRMPPEIQFVITNPETPRRESRKPKGQHR
ncbi:hypothetical protein [Bosea sp. 2RAB26]|uniref:hypothetical protein n=1 Tax=Bosea sp. 2RAB26 TaxID=3237476 RepID=UPI003F90A9C0